MTRRSSAFVVALAVLLVAAVIGFLVVRRPVAVAAVPAPALATTTVRKTDLSDTRMVGGTLGYGSAHPIKGTGSGVLTALPAVGATVARGKSLYRVDDQPVVVLYGDTPLFRPIDKAGLVGRDVLELRRNLTALGYHPGVSHSDARVGATSAASSGSSVHASSGSLYRVSDISDLSLLGALRRWQKDLGLPTPGALQPRQAVVVSGPGRVNAVTAQLGDSADEPILAVTSTTKVVTVPMSPADASPLHAGLVVSIALPDGHAVPGKISAVSQTVSDGSDQGDPPKINVLVTPDKPVTAFSSAPVQVRFTTVTRRGVLAVPVGALVALREGGYAVQRPDGTLIAATTGLFAGGMVQVSGPAIADGTTVVTTS